MIVYEDKMDMIVCSRWESVKQYKNREDIELNNEQIIKWK